MPLLFAAQALGGASPPIIISLGGLVGQQLANTPTAATLPVSLYQLGLALSTLPAAWLMQRFGRRLAYVLPRWIRRLTMPRVSSTLPTSSRRNTCSPTSRP